MAPPKMTLMISPRSMRVALKNSMLEPLPPERSSVRHVSDTYPYLQQTGRKLRTDTDGSRRVPHLAETLHFPL
jgi:hypothetical protein